MPSSKTASESYRSCEIEYNASNPIIKDVELPTDALAVCSSHLRMFKLIMKKCIVYGIGYAKKLTFLAF